MWIFFALLAPLLFAIVHVMDSYCVEEIFEKPWMGMITSAFASIIIYAPLPFILPFINVEWPSINIILLAMLAGAFIQISQALYFQSLGYSEAAVVSAYWNLIPIFIGLISFLLFKDILEVAELIGVIILIAASIQILFVDTNYTFRLRTFLMMALASFIQAMSYVVLDHVYAQSQFLPSYIFVTTGLIITGILPLLSKNVRKEFLWKTGHLNSSNNIFILIEIVNLIALASAEKAIQLGNPTLVAAVETTIPAFTIIISICLYLGTKGKYGDARSNYKLVTKFTAVCLMTFGVILVS